MRGKLLLYILLLVSGVLRAQTITMHNGSVSTCSGVFYDSGGALGSYAPNESYQLTICPDSPNSYIQLNFSVFDTEDAPWDALTIFQGADTSGDVIGSFGGFISPITSCGGGTIVSSDPSGCITLTYVSDAVIEHSGWAAAISCSNVPGGTNPPGPPNAVCSGANPFCANAGPLEFPNISNTDCVPDAPAVIPQNTCLGSAPNPAWYYLEVDQSGDLTLEIQQTTGTGGSGTGLDVDFAIWGPYPNKASACSSFAFSNVVDCSYSVAAVETANIPNAISGEIYMVLITNFNGAPGYIKMTQTNSGSPDAGSTDCSIVCPIATGTNPSCGASNGMITISGFSPNTSYVIGYFDDGVPVAVPATSNAAGEVFITGLDAGSYTNIVTSFPNCANSMSDVILTSGSGPLFTSLAGGAPICAGGNAVFTLVGTPGATVSYNINSGATQTVVLNASGNATVTVPGVSADTTLNVTQIGFPATGCNTSVAATQTVLVTGPPVVNISYASTQFCTAPTGSRSPTLTGSGTYTGGTFSASPAGLTINANSGNIVPSTSTPGTYTITYTTTSSGLCPTVTATTTVAITALTSAEVEYPSASYCTTAPPQMVELTGTGNYTSGVFSASPAGLSIDATTGTITPSSSAPGTYTITYAIPASGGCPAVSKSANVIIDTGATAEISFPASTYCTNSPPVMVNFSGTGAYTGGTFASSPAGLSIDPVTGTISPDSSASGNYSITYTLSSNGGCDALTVITPVEIVMTPTAQISYALSSYCANAGVQNLNLTGTGTFTGGTFSSSPAGLSMNSATGAVDPATSQPGTYTVNYSSNPDGVCGPVTAETTISISDGVTVEIAYASDVFCTNVPPLTVNLSGTGSFGGGTFSATPPGLDLNDVTGTVSPISSAPGTYQITYTIPGRGGCPATSSTTSVEIIQAPTVSIHYGSNAFCASSAIQPVSISGTGMYSGGNFSSSPVGISIDASTGEINPSMSLPGVYTITYVAPSISGCSPVTDTFQFTIASQATAEISYPSSIMCEGAPNQPATLSGTGMFSGGVFTATPSGLALDASTGTINPSSSEPGDYVISYTIPAVGGCNQVVADFPMSITGAATAAIAYSSPSYCSSAPTQAIMLTGTGAFQGGVFSASPAGLDIDPVSGAINPASSISSNYTVTYFLAASGGCPAIFASTALNISKDATAAISYASDTYCAGSGFQNVVLTGSGAYLGGTFSASPSGLQINAATGTITPAASSSGTYTITYSLPTAGGCEPFSVSTTVEILTGATASIGYSATSYCESASDESVSLSGTGAFSGGTFSSSPAGLTIDALTGTISPSSSVAGTYTITYFLAGSGCGNISATTTVTIASSSTALIGYPSMSYCNSNADEDVILSGTGSFVGGTFSSTPTGLMIDAATGTISPSLSNAGTYTVIYSVSAGECGSIAASTTVTITSSTTASISYPSASYCNSDADENVAILGTGTFLGGSFSSSPAGLAIDASTGTISPSSSATGSYTVTYFLSGSGCGNISATTTVTIEAASTISLQYPSVAFCHSASPQLPILSLLNPTITFAAVPAGLSIDPVTGVISPAQCIPGTYEITATAALGTTCGTVSDTFQITIVSAPTVSLSYPSALICTTNPQQMPILSGSGTYTGGMFTASPSGLALDPITGVIDPVASNPGDYVIAYLTMSVSGCPVVTSTFDVSVTAAPTAAISYQSSAFCNNGAIEHVSLIGTGTYQGGSFSASPSGMSINPVTGDINLSASNPGSYVVSYSVAPSGGCASVTALTNVTISEPASVSICYPVSEICASDIIQHISMSGTGPFSGGTFSATPVGLSISAGGTINPGASIPGTYTIHYAAPGSAGCPTATASTSVTILPLPTVSVVGSDTSICSGETVVLQLNGSVPGTTFTWTATGNGANGSTSGTGDVISDTLTASASAVGSVTYTIVPTANGCTGNPYSLTVFVNPIPVPDPQDGFICVDPQTGVAQQSYVLESNLSGASHSFQWSLDGVAIPGATSANYPATVGGIYSVVATSNQGCVSDIAEATVTEVSIATSLNVSGQTMFAHDPSVSVEVNGSNNYEYQLDNNGFVSSNSFFNLTPGHHIITVRDPEGCTNLSHEFDVVSYPPYFTPNGDGFHETWNIHGIPHWQKATIFIFDRYGKLLKQIDPQGEGWDGTFNGHAMPSTDYWFSIDYYENGGSRTFKSHFSLKR